MAKVQRCCYVEADLLEVADAANMNVSRELTAALCARLGHPGRGVFCFCGEVRKENARD